MRKYLLMGIAARRFFPTFVPETMGKRFSHRIVCIVTVCVWKTSPFAGRFFRAPPPGVEYFHTGVDYFYILFAIFEPENTAITLSESNLAFSRQCGPRIGSMYGNPCKHHFDMNLDRLKPDLTKLNMAELKRTASRVKHVRVRMNRKDWIGLAAAVLIAAGVLYLILRPRPAVIELPVVAVEPVTTEDVNIYGEYVGRIRAQQFVEIRARVEGYLERMLFAEGTYVKKGQTLFIIDPKLYRARVDKAKAQLNKARAQAQKAERDLNRIRPLYEQSAASQLDLDNAIASYESAVADVVVGEADLTQAEMTLGYTSVIVPHRGLHLRALRRHRHARGSERQVAAGHRRQERHRACRLQHDGPRLPALARPATSTSGTRTPRASGIPTSP